jgi:hypothetical protein
MRLDDTAAWTNVESRLAEPPPSRSLMRCASTKALTCIALVYEAPRSRGAMRAAIGHIPQAENTTSGRACFERCPAHADARGCFTEVLGPWGTNGPLHPKPPEISDPTALVRRGYCCSATSTGCNGRPVEEVCGPRVTPDAGSSSSAASSRAAAVSGPRGAHGPGSNGASRSAVAAALVLVICVGLCCCALGGQVRHRCPTGKASLRRLRHKEVRIDKLQQVEDQDDMVREHQGMPLHLQPL